jgi:predicted nucleic acid-binding protein
VIVADTGAVLALLDADDRHHARLAQLFEASASEWVIPWPVLPEVDHLARSRLGRRVASAFFGDVATGRLTVEWGVPGDLRRALQLDGRYADLSLGLVDTVVMAMSERLGARAIVTLDERHFGAVELEGSPEIWPRDRAGG